MPRKKQATEAMQTESGTARAVAEPTKEDQGQPEGRNWGNPYKALVTTADFEMGEDRRFKQRVFLFKEKPSDEVLAALKENGFTYRANEKAWTIQANPDTRRLADELAREFAGQTAGVSR
jgi:hypothetical protein